MITRLTTVALFCFLAAGIVRGNGLADPTRPNVIIIFCDDLGYADVGCYGANDIPTPNIDRMAKEGVRFTDFYATASFCTPSRTGLMTACYPQRVGMVANVHPNRHWGLNPSETTIAEVFQSVGYVTGCFGKWHLGNHKSFLPMSQGFSESLIIPYSHDMYRGAPWGSVTKEFPLDYVPVIRGDATVDRLRTLDDFSRLTSIFHEAATDFIRNHADERFFVYLPHAMPHLEIRPPAKWKGVSKRGPYGDVIAELDAAIGGIFETLKDEGIDDQTLVVFSSDNGPARIYQKPTFKGGSVGPLSGQKGSSREGGFRVPGIFRWPRMIPPGTTCQAMTTTMDLLPTCARLIGADLPELPIDGHDIGEMLRHPETAKTPYERFFYYRSQQLHAVRSGPWKLWPKRGNGIVQLYNLSTDTAESRNVAEHHPEIVDQLMAHVQHARRTLGDDPGAAGTGLRSRGELADKH